MKTVATREMQFFRPDADSRRSVHLDWLEDYTPYAMAEAFKEIADSAVTSVLRRRRHPDAFFYAIASTYRHYIELQLKNIIDLGSRTDLAVDYQERIMKRHDLPPLWNVAKAMIARRWPDADLNELEIIDKAVEEFSALDPYGQAFRYDRDLRGKKNLTNAPRIIGLKNLRRQIKKVFDLLSGCEMEFRHYASSEP